MLPKWVSGAVSCQRTKKFCNNFCVRAVKAEPALSRSKAETAGTCRTGVPRATCEASTHKGHVLGGGKTGHTSKCIISMPFREFNPLWFGCWLRQILFFKSLNNASFPQQPIRSGCRATLSSPVCPLCHLCSDSEHT